MELAKRLVCVVGLVLSSTGFAAAQGEEDARSGTGVPEALGVAVYPEAIPRPAVARALEAYYRPAIGQGATLEVAVYETAASFESVYDFYSLRMPPGRWGWREKTFPLRHQTETLKFHRSQLAGQGEKAGRLGDVFAPLLGDPDLDQAAFTAEIDRLVERYPEAEIRVAEGSRRVGGDPAGAQVRVQLERPFLDLDRMEIVDRTRIVFVKVAGE